jgi:two-component system OmpR family response regulator
VDVARAPDVPAIIEGIAIVRWPEETPRATELQRSRSPRLLLVAPDAAPPELDDDDPSVDWVFEPVDENALHARIVALLSAASVVKPILGDHGVLWRGETWIALSPIEERLTAALLARPGRVLGRARLEHAGWPDGLSNDRAIDASITRLRKRLSPAGVRIHAVRGHGYLAEIQPV